MVLTWPGRPADKIVFELGDRHSETVLTCIFPSAGDPPDRSKAGHIRKRMNQLLFAELRNTYANEPCGPQRVISPPVPRTRTPGTGSRRRLLAYR